MAIDLRSVYGIQVLSGQPGYPYGKARNVTVAGDGTGTPWEAALVNDFVGFEQALLSEAGILPSGTPDRVGASDYLNAIKYLTRNITGNVSVQGLVTCIGSGNGFEGDFFQVGGSVYGVGGNVIIVPSLFFQAIAVAGAGPSSFAHQVNVTPGGIVVSNGGVEIGNGFDGIVVQAGGITVLAGTLDFTPPATFRDEIVLADAGRIRERVAYAPDADHTFGPTDATVIVAQSGVVLAGRIWKLNDAAAEGATLRLVNYTGFTMTLHNSSGGVLLAAPNVAPFSGATPGTVRLIWLNNGAYTGWSAY